MKAVAGMALFVMATLGVVAIAVFGFGDRRTFVSPPATVVEDFVRALQCRRFPQAQKYFAGEARAGLSPELLADATSRLESRIGRIEEVTGEEGWMAGDEAEAVALLKTDSRDEVRMPLRLHREKGEWRLMGIEGLAAP
jgi:hypothetical protein